MATIYIENVPYEVKDGQNLLTACLSLGFNIPYFCWHPALHSVGSCRLCAVKVFRDAKDTRGHIMMSCMTPASDGTRLSVDDPEVKEFRAAVLEWLMINHPHDCPVCDEGGECHLQDMTVMTGHNYRRTRSRKRTFRNQNLGPFINHEMNRCIQCYRCVRFYRDYAGGRDLNVFGIHDRLYFGRFEDGALESRFSGNLVEVCPTGVFTDKTLRRHYTRKWDLQTAPSVCVHCGLGCNTIPGERYGMLRRILNRYHEEVNGYFLCDRGRFGYEFVNDDKRLKSPLVRRQAGQGIASFDEITAEDALDRLAVVLNGASGIIGIGSPRASLESNFALARLVGPGCFFSGLAAGEHDLVATILSILCNGPARSPSLQDVERSDAVLVLGEDIPNTAPRMALSLRQSVRVQPMKAAVERLKIPLWSAGSVKQACQDDKGPLFVVTPGPTGIDDVAAMTFQLSPDDIARLGFAVAAALDPSAAPAVGALSEELKAAAARIAEALQSADRPLVVSGTGCGSKKVVEAAANVAWALCRRKKDAAISLVVPECNSLGAGLMGGASLDEAFEQVRSGRADTVVIMENDLYRRAASSTITEFLEKAGTVVVLDHLANRCTDQADLVLPVGTFAESDGTLVNVEGRAQRFYRVFVGSGDMRAGWQWLAPSVGGAKPWETLDEVDAALASAIPIFEPILHLAPPAGFRIEGLKIAREAHRYSGRTAMKANVNVHEQAPPVDRDSALAFSMEGYQGQPPSALVSRYWAPGWNSVQSLNKFQSEVGGPLRGGNPGRRLIEPSSGGRSGLFQEVPGAVERPGGRCLVVPLHHVFGSEELSTLSQGISDSSPTPYLGMAEETALSLGIGQGDWVTLTLEAAVYSLKAKIVEGLAPEILGLPVGLPNTEKCDLPAWGEIAKAKKTGEFSSNG